MLVGGKMEKNGKNRKNVSFHDTFMVTFMIQKVLNNMLKCINSHIRYLKKIVY